MTDPTVTPRLHVSPFSGDWDVRDCPWCGSDDAEPQYLATNLRAERCGSTPRHWSVVSCRHCGGAVLIEHTAPSDAQAQPLRVVPERVVDARIEQVPAALRTYYEDAIRVLEAVATHASDVDEKTARRALQFTTQVLRNLFEIPAQPATRPEREPEDEPSQWPGSW